MTTATDTNSPSALGLTDPAVPSGKLVFLLAISCGLIVANIYYAQTLIGPIGATLGLSVRAAGLIVTVTQIGYALGLLSIVPLADLFENRRLVVTILGVGALALASAAMSERPATFLIAALLIGIGSVAVQVLVPYAAHLAPEAVRGLVVGNVMSGLMIGIMISRPLASFLTSVFSWRVVFGGSSLVMVALAAVLRVALPRRVPVVAVRYSTLLASMVRLGFATPTLQKRALYQAFLFGAFSLFWTTIPLVLATRFHFSQAGIAVFALIGVAGAVAAPMAGRAADRGWSGLGTAASIIAVGCAFLLTHVAAIGSLSELISLVLAGVLLDLGVQANVVFGYRALFVLGAEYRGRLNGLYMATFFLAGAAGSALGGWSYERGGWTLTSWIGFALPVCALCSFALAERKPRATPL